nr:bifunctional diaminohydroxyphosphoribosylaminopyrimidine deaminase/5-amino-6-(5-phosphoribosylamino)uracil reductase RibD [Campylobacter pinnipediorum]
MIISDEFFMDLAIRQAWKYSVLTYPNPSVGCAILDKNGTLLSCQAHKKAGFLHAEPTAILFALFKLNEQIFFDFTKAYYDKFFVKFLSIKELEEYDLESNFTYKFILENHSNLLKDAKAYVTLEPCTHHGKTPPCVNLFIRLKFKDVIISCMDFNDVASGGIELLKQHNINTKVGVCVENGRELIDPFLSWQKGNFSFLKLAISLNGVITGGIISNALSRTHSHKLRDVSELLIIGGNTVRIDRPTLDTRLIQNGKNPDVLIYSRQNDFDKNIPLFGVKDRKVFISNSLENLEKKLVMYEGGAGMLKLAFDGKIPNLKRVLLYKSNELKDGENIKFKNSFRPIFESNFENDNYGWYEINQDLS